MSILSNASVVVAGRFAGLGLQLLTAVVMARLLTPSDFGAFAVSAGLAGLLYAFREFGVTNFLIRAERVDDRVVGSVLVVSGGMSMALGGALSLMAPVLAGWYNDRQLLGLIYLLAANFLVYPFSMLCGTLLQREERFPVLVLNGLAAALASSLTSIGLALAGAGAIALAVGVLASSLVSLLLGLRAHPAGLTFRPAVGHVGEVFRFGGWITGVSIATQFAQRAPELIIGKTLGLGAAGLFDKGGALVRLFQQGSSSIIQVVVFSGMAREQREGDDPAAAFWYRLAILTGLLWPLFIFLSFNAHALILLVFGSQWVEVAPAASLLALNGMLMAPFLLGDQVLIIRSKVRALFLQRFALLVLKVILLWLVSPFGLTALAGAVLLPTLVYLYLNLGAVLSEIDGEWRTLRRALEGSLWLAVGAIGAGILTLYLFGYSGADNLVGRLVFSVSATGLVWLVQARLIAGPAWQLSRRLFDAVSRRRRWLWDRWNVRVGGGMH